CCRHRDHNRCGRRDWRWREWRGWRWRGRSGRPGGVGHWRDADAGARYRRVSPAARYFPHRSPPHARQLPAVLLLPLATGLQRAYRPARSSAGLWTSALLRRRVCAVSVSLPLLRISVLLRTVSLLWFRRTFRPPLVIDSALP